MEDNTIVLLEEQTDELVVVGRNLKFRKGNRAKNGETYSRFRHKGIVFSVPDNDNFLAPFENGEVVKVVLLKKKETIKRTKVDAQGAESEVESTEDTLQLDSFLTRTKLNNRLAGQFTTAALRAKIDNAARIIATAPINEEEFAEMVQSA